MADGTANLAIGTVLTAPSPAASGTTLTLTTGHGARMPPVPFQATVWLAGASPDPTNAEIVRVTGVAGDIVTMARAQEGTAARTIVAGDQFAATFTKRTLDGITDRAGTVTSFGDLISSGAVYYLAHRGCGDERPEHTLVAYRAAAAQGASVVEVSFSNTLDGQLICNHDLTLDRSTNLTGNVNARTWPELQNNAVVDIGAQFLGPNWANQPMSLLAQVHSELGGRVALIEENKSGSSTNMTKMLAQWARYGQKDLFCYKVFRVASTGGIPAHAQTVRTAGYKVWAYFDGTETNPMIDATAAAADLVGAVSTMSDATISYVVSRGTPVIVYEVHRRSERDRFVALGVKGLMCSGITYVSGTTAISTASRFDSGVQTPGDMAGTDTQVPTWDTANRALVLPPATNSSYLLGSMSPVANAGGTYTITYAMRWTTLPGDTTTHGDFIFGHADDVRYTHQSTSNTGGYHVVFRANGQLQLFRHDAGSGTGTQLGVTQATTAAVAGQWITFSLTVTPTSLSVIRTDEASTAVTSTNTTYRGGYLHLAAGSSSTAVGFRDVVVS